MSGPVGLTYPGSRVLAGWAKHLLSWKPVAAWVGHLIYHQLDVPVVIRVTEPLGLLQQIALDALNKKASSPSQLAERLAWPFALASSIIHKLDDWGAAHISEGIAELTPQGRESLKRGTLESAIVQRRSFQFIESEVGDTPFNFVNFPKALCGSPWSGSIIRPEVITACCARDLDWKIRRGFPVEVIALGQERTDSGSPVELVELPVDRAESVTIALVQTDGDELLGFSVNSDGWILNAREPLVRLDSTWREILPELAQPTSLGLWEHDWAHWCQSRGVSPLDAQACTIELLGFQARLLAPEKVAARLRQSRADLMKGEAWLISGSGRLRRALPLCLI